MSGRLARWVALVLVLLAFALQLQRANDRIAANVALARAESATLQAARMGAAGRPLLGSALDLLRRAQARDPLEVGIQIAIGSIHLVLGSPQAAIAAYQKANELEPRPETYLNLGRAQLVAGQVEAAKASFKTTFELDLPLAEQIPAGMLPTTGSEAPHPP